MFSPAERAYGVPLTSREQLLRRLIGGAWLLLLWVGLAAVMLVNLGANQRVEAGIVSQEDIRAPERVTYQSAIRTQRERDRAASAVEPIFFPPDRSQAVAQTGTAQAVARYLEAVRADPYADEDSKVASVAALQPVRFDADVTRSILTMNDEQWAAVVTEMLRVLDTQMRGEIRETRLPTVLRSLPNQISISLSDSQAQVVTAWAGALITPNTFLDNERTAQARQAAEEGIAPVEWTYEAGQILVREGEIVTPEQVEALQQMGLQQPARSASGMAGTGLFLFLLVTALGLYLSRVHPEHFGNQRVMALIVIQLLVLTAGARAVMPDHLLLRYMLPTAASSMLLGVLLGVDLALLVTVLLSLIVGFLTNSMELTAYTFVGGLMAALVLWRVERLNVFVWTGALVGLTNIGIVLVFALQDGALPWVQIAATSGMALLNGVASASVALVGFYVLSSLLGITTFLQLMELARPTHPLFRELLLNAPGTYHHSIIVSNLAEAAAEAVGADMLLVRVGAYYHDVGKVKNPSFFVENQADGVNQHDELNNPYRSAQIILDHVTDGVKLAQRHKLPQRMIDFIQQHHGTTCVAWFYGRACAEDGKERVDEAQFRYAGPKPQSREAAILMLADTVEATARAVKPAGKEEIDALINKLMTDKLGDGQLEECELNLRDIYTIRKAFVKVLQGIYHPRISYPEAKRPALATPLTPSLTPPREESHERSIPPATDPSAVGSRG